MKKERGTSNKQQVSSNKEVKKGERGKGVRELNRRHSRENGNPVIVTYPPCPLPLGLREGGRKMKEGSAPLLDAPFLLKTPLIPLYERGTNNRLPL